uniref:BTB_2 domain-containing protein n=1 Tax=Macrostomum lignano TaxID=282301 RepID=A0A1I8FEB3_9PLAT
MRPRRIDRSGANCIFKLTKCFPSGVQSAGGRLTLNRQTAALSYQCLQAASQAEGGEYYFERHPEVFADILHFYRTDEIATSGISVRNVVKRETLAGIDNTFLTGKAARRRSPGGRDQWLDKISPESLGDSGGPASTIDGF